MLDIKLNKIYNIKSRKITTFPTKKKKEIIMKTKKHLFGVCRVGEKGQIVIPKEARKIFDIKVGDSLLLLGDEKKGMALIKTEVFEDSIKGVLDD